MDGDAQEPTKHLPTVPDYTILAAVVAYALSLIDAYVDAQLFDYDISPDLSIHLQPQIMIDGMQQKNAELKFAIQF